MSREVKLPSGKTVRICGMPIGHTEEQLKQRFPEMVAAMEAGNASALADAIIVMSGNLIDQKDCWVDEYTYGEIEKIFFGSLYDKIKKKTGPVSADISAPVIG